jgi:integrase
MSGSKKRNIGIRWHHGSWHVRYYDPVTGKERSKAGFRNQTEARKWKEGIETDKRRGQYHDHHQSKLPFTEAADRFMGHKIRIRPRTRDKYESAIRCHLEPGFGRQPIGTITRDRVQTWVAGLVQDGLAPETVRGLYSLLAAILKHAADDGLIPRSPCRGIEVPRTDRVEQRYLNESQVERLAAAFEARYRTMIYTSCYLGLRWQELAGLKRDLVSMRPGRLATVRIVATIERSNGHYRPVNYGKSDAARRTLKAPEFLREMLAWHLHAFPSDGWVFPAPESGFLRYDNFRNRVWTPSVKAAGLSPLTFHQLRHTAAAFMIDDGADPLQIKRRMGHEDVRTTLNLYGHLFPDREEELVAGLDRRKAKADQMRTTDAVKLIDLDVKRAADLVLRGVDQRGIEPLTSPVRGVRSTN